MRMTSIVVAMITLASVLAVPSTVDAQEHWGHAVPRRSINSGVEEITRKQERRETQTGTVVKGETPAAWEAVRRFRASGRPAILGITINDREQGVAVLRVSPGGPADENGIQTGDLIVAVDGAGLTDSERRSPAETLIAQMATVNPGDTLTLTVRRGEDDRDIEIVARALGPDSYFVL